MPKPELNYVVDTDKVSADFLGFEKTGTTDPKRVKQAFESQRKKDARMKYQKFVYE